jgi:chemotaxis protein methyltransferase CheR
MSESESEDDIYPGLLVNHDRSSSARKTLRFIKRDIFYDLLLYPYGKYKHQKIRASATRDDHHTHTAFYRSPGQLQALIGPVYTHLMSQTDSNALVICVFAGSNGAEAYTIASVLLNHFPKLSLTVHCSDLHQEKVEEAQRGIYSLKEITQDQAVPKQFLDDTFDRVGNKYHVKPLIQKCVTFTRSDILNDTLSDKFPKSDIVCAQNVFCHMTESDAEKGFLNILSLTKDRSALFIDGMYPELRSKLTGQANLEPLAYNHKKIYKHSRMLLSPSWWSRYYGREPYLFFKREKIRRYSTIFLRSHLLK